MWVCEADVSSISRLSRQRGRFWVVCVSNGGVKSFSLEQAWTKKIHDGTSYDWKLCQSIRFSLFYWRREIDWQCHPRSIRPDIDTLVFYLTALIVIYTYTKCCFSHTHHVASITESWLNFSWSSNVSKKTTEFSFSLASLNYISGQLLIFFRGQLISNQKGKSIRNLFQTDSSNVIPLRSGTYTGAHPGAYRLSPYYPICREVPSFSREKTSENLQRTKGL